ncbi:MAG: HlyD family type I secretion periplasmic adaptor subunit [Bradyrhizobiaceae bacterium]|nr:HlyD family type I secretion periplasmic adaptor subunit [Bradyrhizobiaceae bacterium]
MTSRSGSDEAAFLDGVVPPVHRRDVVAPARNFNSIAVVVGKKQDAGVHRRPPPSASQSYPPPYPPPKRPSQKPPQPPPKRSSQPRGQRPGLPVVSRVPALRDMAGSTAARTAAGSVAVLKRAYGAVFNPEDRDLEVTETDGFKADLQRSFEKQRRAGGRVLAVSLIVGGGWATLIPLSGAVVLPGTVVAESAVKKIQHPIGGIVSSIAVTDGMRVKQGDVLMRLDDTQVRANYQVVSQQLEEIRARIARLSAERDGRDDQALPGKPAKPAGEQLLSSENSLFKARSDARRSQRELLRGRITQLNDEIAGMDAQAKSKQTQTDLILQELKGVQELWDKRLTPLTRLTSLQREAARLDGEKAQLVSGIAETRGKIAEAELQLVKLDQDFKADVMKDLREAQDKEAELNERVVSAKDQVDHIELRAPVNGIVHELAVHTVGGVVTPAQVVMVIVPEGDDLQIDAHLPPDEIDQVHKGQSAQVRFPAFNQRTTPEVTGTIARVSADITKDQPQSMGYYTVRVSLSGDQLTKIGDRQLISGMPAEVFIQTGSRTMMSYMFKPITEQFERMFRER